MKVDKYKLSLEILEYFSKQDKNKYVLRANVIGLDYQEGDFGLHYKRALSNEERSMLDLTLKELQEKRLIQPVYKDLMSRGEDLQITDKGQRALEKRVIDELDELLFGLSSDSNLIRMRYGAYDAILDRQADWQRHAAASLVELVDHTLRTIAPNDKVTTQSWYLADTTSRTGITRRHRVRYFLEQKNLSRSKNDEDIIEKAYQLIDSCKRKLEGIKHESGSKEEAEQLIKLVEDALLYLLR